MSARPSPSSKARQRRSIAGDPELTRLEADVFSVFLFFVFIRAVCRCIDLHYFLILRTTGMVRLMRSLSLIFFKGKKGTFEIHRRTATPNRSIGSE